MAAVNMVVFFDKSCGCSALTSELYRIAYFSLHLSNKASIYGLQTPCACRAPSLTLTFGPHSDKSQQERLHRQDIPQNSDNKVHLPH